MDNSAATTPLTPVVASMPTSTALVILSQFRSGIFRAIFAIKEIRNGKRSIDAFRRDALVVVAAPEHGLPEVEGRLADRGYDADWFRNTPIGKGTKHCIPGRKNTGRKSRKTIVTYDKRRYKRRNRIERMYGRRKDWRRVATR